MNAPVTAQACQGPAADASPPARSTARARSTPRRPAAPTSACRSARSRSPTRAEPPVRVYDPSGPYTETDAGDRPRRRACRCVREPWIAARGYAAVRAARR